MRRLAKEIKAMEDPAVDTEHRCIDRCGFNMPARCQQAHLRCCVVSRCAPRPLSLFLSPLPPPSPSPLPLLSLLPFSSLPFLSFSLSPPLWLPLSSPSKVSGPPPPPPPSKFVRVTGGLQDPEVRTEHSVEPEKYFARSCGSVFNKQPTHTILRYAATCYSGMMKARMR